MKNITVSVPDDVYRAARVRAAERGSSVSALVAEYLRSLSDREAEFARLEKKRRRIIAGITGFRAGDRLSRDELAIFPVQPVTKAIVLAAIAARERFGISYWDAAIIEAARAAGCDVVLSEDLSDGADYGGVRVESPFRGL